MPIDINNIRTKLSKYIKGNELILKELPHGYIAVMLDDFKWIMDYIEAGETSEERKKRLEASGYIEYLLKWKAEGLVTREDIPALGEVE